MMPLRVAITRPGDDPLHAAPHPACGKEEAKATIIPLYLEARVEVPRPRR